MELQQGPNSSKMTMQEIDELLQVIEESNNSNQWSDRLKQQLMSRVKDNLSKTKMKEAWVKQQVKELEVDPLEIEVVDKNGQVVASRHWKCNARNCNFQYYRGNCSRLAIKVQANELDKLIGKGQHACLKHFCVQNKNIDFCHSYFKLHQKLPEGAFLKLRIDKTKAPQPTPSIVTELQPLSSTSSLQIDGKKNHKQIFSMVYGSAFI